MSSHRIIAIALFVLVAPPIAAQTDADRLDLELKAILSPDEREFLQVELARISPPERIRELAAYGARQSELGGGFYGMMPDQLAEPDSIPVPIGPQGLDAAALCLARQRSVNLTALEQINPDFPKEFRGELLPDFLQNTRVPGSVPVIDLQLNLDTSAIEGFVLALKDGEITADEAAALAALPSNQAMLEHRRNLGYVPEPLPDTEDLAQFILMAGSDDPLDRLWCWVNSQNAFGYADLSQHVDGYRTLVRQLDTYGEDLARAALDRIARFTPEGTQFETTFGFTVGWAIRGWATPEMAGLNIEQVKDDWPFLFGTLVEESYHRLQLQLIPSSTDAPAREFSDLVVIDTGDERLDRLYEIVTYTVAEGAANLVRGPFADAKLDEKAPKGAELMARFVRQVVDDGDVERADELINEGLKNNGPLYGLGWRLASVIAKGEGGHAVGDWQQRGPVPFFLHGAELADAEGRALLDPAVIAAVGRLESID